MEDIIEHDIGVWSERYLVFILNFLIIEKSSSLHRKKSRRACLLDTPCSHVNLLLWGLFTRQSSISEKSDIVWLWSLSFLGCFGTCS